MEQLKSVFDPDRLYAIGVATLRVAVVVFLAFIATKLIRIGLARFNQRLLKRMEGRQEQSSEELERRANTINGILVTSAVVLIWAFAVMMSLRELGFDIGPLLAGAGVLGLAIGFGAQSLVADVITGALMLLENQIRVGDVAVINDQGGLVERINLRTTALRSLDGTLHIFPNSKINRVSNMTYEFSYYVFDVGVAYKEDTDRVTEVLYEIGNGLAAEPEFAEVVLAPFEVLGVDSFGDSAVIIKARIKTKPLKQWTVGREMNRRIKKRFDELNIEIPFPHQSIYFGEASKPFSIFTEQNTGDGRPTVAPTQGRKPADNGASAARPR